MKEYYIVHIWGDKSGINAARTDIVPPDKELLIIDLPNSDDFLFVASKSKLMNPSFIKERIPQHLFDEYGEQVLSSLGVEWLDDDGNWNYF